MRGNVNPCDGSGRWAIPIPNRPGWGQCRHCSIAIRLTVGGAAYKHADPIQGYVKDSAATKIAPPTPPITCPVCGIADVRDTSDGGWQCRRCGSSDKRPNL